MTPSTSAKAVRRLASPALGLRANSSTSTRTPRGSIRYASKATWAMRRIFCSSGALASAASRMRDRKPPQPVSNTSWSSSSLFRK